MNTTAGTNTAAVRNIIFHRESLDLKGMGYRLAGGLVACAALCKPSPSTDSFLRFLHNRAKWQGGASLIKNL